MNGQPRFDREILNGGSSFLTFSLSSLRRYNISIFFFDFFVFALLFRYFKSSIDIIPFLSQESDNRFFIRFLPLTDKSYDSRSIEEEERKRAEYRCSNWTRERSISSVVKFFATRGKIGNKIRDEYGVSFTCPWKTALYIELSVFFSFLIFPSHARFLLYTLFTEIYILIYYIIPLLHVPLQNFREK